MRRWTAPTSGTVNIGDTDLIGLKDKALTRLRRDRIGFVFQSFNLVPTLTAEENILLPLSIAGRKPDPEWYDTVIDTVGARATGSTTGPTSSPAASSSGSPCARALVSRPSIVFADEPTGNLDSRSGAEVLGFLRRSVDEFGQTIVMVTHDPIAAGLHRPGHLPRRRQGRRRDALADRRDSARADDDLRPQPDAPGRGAD